MSAIFNRLRRLEKRWFETYRRIGGPSSAAPNPWSGYQLAGAVNHRGLAADSLRIDALLSSAWRGLDGCGRGIHQVADSIAFGPDAACRYPCRRSIRLVLPRISLLTTRSLKEHPHKSPHNDKTEVTRIVLADCFRFPPSRKRRSRAYVNFWLSEWV
jgi:hypothetical protein